MRQFGLAAGLLLAAPAYAQEADPEITVTGHGMRAPPGDAAYAAVTLDADRLQGTASNRLEDALRDVAGLAQFRRSDSRSSHPTAQGITLRGLGGNASSRVLLLLDGVPQSDPFGGWVAFPAYLPTGLESARVIRGGGSGYAGPGALAGTIELTSAGPRPFALGLAYGSRDSVEAQVTGSAQSDRGFVTLAAHYARGDGFIPVIAGQRGPADRPAPYEQAGLALRGVVDLGGTELQASLSGFRDRRDRGVDFTLVKSDGVDGSVRLVGTRWSALAYVQTRQFASGFASIDAARTAAAPTLDQYNVPATGVGGRFEIEPLTGSTMLRLGADIRAVSGRTQELYTYVAGLPTRRREAGGRSLTFGAFADASYERGGLTLSAGGRVDRWRISGGHLLETPLAGGVALTDLAFADRSGWEATGRIGAALTAGEGVTFRAAGYRGWRLPTLNELYRPFRVGADATAANALLAPERLTGAELGVTLAPLDTFSLSATGYWSRIDGAIANVTLATGPGNFPGVGFVSAAGVYRQRRNLDSVEARGIELDGRFTSGPIFVNASYALNDARVRGSGAAAPLDGLRPAQTARHQGSATIGWQKQGVRAAVTARYVAPQFEDDQNARRLASAFTLDGVLRVPVRGGFAVELRGENLFDARVEAGISGPGIIERASPRTLWIGLSYAPRR